MKFTLTPAPPFNFELTAGFFSYDDPEIRTFKDGVFQQVLTLNKKLALIFISSEGSTEKPKLVCELRSIKKLNSKDVTRAKTIIDSIFNLDIDLNSFYSYVKNDKVLSKIVMELNGLKGPNNTTVFEGLVCSIIEQQISLNVAFTVQKRFIKTFGQILRLDDNKYHAFPKPADIVNETMESFRSCGLSERKAEYIKGVAELITENALDLEKFTNYPEPDLIISELTKIRGIGVWTVELTMLRSMGRFDVIPADDLGLKRYVSNCYFNGRKITSADVRNVLGKFGMWKGLAAYYLLEADRLGLDIIERTQKNV